MSPQLFADYIDNGDKQFYGKIVYINTDKIILKESCTGKNMLFYWDDNLTIKFTDQCDHPGWDLSTSPVTADLPCSKRKVFEFYIKSNNSHVYADEFSFNNGALHIVYSKGNGTENTTIVNLYKVIDWVSYRTVCESDIPDNF